MDAIIHVLSYPFLGGTLCPRPCGGTIDDFSMAENVSFQDRVPLG